VSRRVASIVAFTVEVLCPYCGGPQPNPDDGGFPWTTEEVASEAAKQPKRTCADCDEIFVLVNKGARS
jgi:hypothetical protein